MARPNAYCNQPLHGYSHFDEMSLPKYWFEDDYFYDLVCINDEVTLNFLKLLYGGQNDPTEYEQNRARYYGTYLQRVPSKETDKGFKECVELHWDPFGITTERPFEDKQRHFIFGRGRILLDPILLQESKYGFFDLPLVIPLTLLVQNHRERLVAVLSEY